MKEFWDERYSSEDYAYGKEPNVFFAEKLVSLPRGKIFLPAEGEGRNAVYAARLGWNVQCFDQSKAGQKKAYTLAKERDVPIQYEVCDFSEINYPENSFDCVAFIFVHLPLQVQLDYHKKVLSYLKPGGHVILEAFHKGHIEYQKLYPKVGGPANLEMLYSAEDVRGFFPNVEILELFETETNLHEGEFHIGKAGVVRFFARKLV